MPSAPELIQNFPLMALTPDFHNPREIDPAGIASLSASLKRFGMVDVLVANRMGDDMVLIAGNQRLMALLKAGVEYAPVLTLELPTADARELGLMLNGHHGEFDQALLEGILRDLAAQGEQIADLPLQGNDGFDAAMAELERQTEGDHGVSIGEGASGDLEARNTELIIGDEHHPIERADYMEWREEFRINAGFSDEQVSTELIRRWSL
jgi:hypothetical protein